MVVEATHRLGNNPVGIYSCQVLKEVELPGLNRRRNWKAAGNLSDMLYINGLVFVLNVLLVV